MKIAVAAIKKKRDSQISAQAGRARFFLIFDTEGDVSETVKNPFSVGGGGAGFAVAKLLADKKVDIFIAGKIGEKMAGAMMKRGIDIREMTGSVSDAVRSISAH